MPGDEERNSRALISDTRLRSIHHQGEGHGDCEGQLTYLAWGKCRDPPDATRTSPLGFRLSALWLGAKTGDDADQASTRFDQQPNIN